MARPLASSSRLRCAERQGGGGPVGRAAESGELQMIARLRKGIGKAGGFAGEQRTRRDVFQHGHLREWLHDLEGAGEAEPGDLVGAEPRDVAPVEGDAARGRRMDRGDQIDQRGLSRLHSVLSVRGSHLLRPLK